MFYFFARETMMIRVCKWKRVHFLKTSEGRVSVICMTMAISVINVSPTLFLFVLTVLIRFWKIVFGLNAMVRNHIADNLIDSYKYLNFLAPKKHIVRVPFRPIFISIIVSKGLGLGSSRILCLPWDRKRKKAVNLYLMQYLVYVHLFFCNHIFPVLSLSCKNFLLKKNIPCR